MFKRIAFTGIACFFCFTIADAASQETPTGVRRPAVEMNLWNDAAPGENGTIPPEEEKWGNERPASLRIRNVSVPTLAFFPAPEGKANGTCIVIFPGGGYNHLAYTHEGTEVADWLNSLGIHAVVCKYRVPRRAGLPKHFAPLQDAQRTVRLVRQNAKRWNVNPDRIGVLGFSAGGHLAILAATAYDEKTYEARDDADHINAKPDFALPIYPAYILGDDKKRWNDPEAAISEEIRITGQTPPMFLSICDDDGVGSMGAVKIYLAMKANKIPCELHLFQKGGHGYGLRPDRGRHARWNQLAEGWFRERGLLSTNKTAD